MTLSPYCSPSPHTLHLHLSSASLALSLALMRPICHIATAAAALTAWLTVCCAYHRACHVWCIALLCRLPLWPSASWALHSATCHCPVLCQQAVTMCQVTAQQGTALHMQQQLHTAVAPIACSHCHSRCITVCAVFFAFCSQVSVSHLCLQCSVPLSSSIASLAS